MKILEIQTWIDMFDPSEINIVKIQEYLEFIKEAIERRDPDRYSESHHILPKCLDEQNIYDNERALINGRDHFLSHIKLVECFNGIKKRSMSCALKLMSENQGKYKVSPEEYEESKRCFSRSVSGENWLKPKVPRIGELSSMYGKHHSEETRRKISESNKGKKRSKEFCQKQSIRNLGNHYGSGNKGKPKSALTCERMSQNHADFSGEKNPMYGRTGVLFVNTVWINDGIYNKRIKKEDLQVYLENNWRLGCLMINTRRGKIVITNNGIIKKYIQPEELNTYLDNGYVLWKDRDSLIKECLIEANNYAEARTTCYKIAVGSLFITANSIKYYSYNYNQNYNCREHNECYKARVSGKFYSTEETRHLCKAVHSEINMINILRQNNVNMSSGVLFVSRYPCESCCRTICTSGIKFVIYGGKVKISDEVEQLFKDNNVTVVHYPEIDFEY